MHATRVAAKADAVLIKVWTDTRDAPASFASSIGRQGREVFPPPQPFGRTRAAVPLAKASRRSRAAGWVFTTPAMTASA